MNSLVAQNKIDLYPKDNQSIAISNIDNIEIENGKTLNIQIFGNKQDLDNIEILSTETKFSIKYKGTNKLSEIKIKITLSNTDKFNFELNNINLVESSDILKINDFNINLNNISKFRLKSESTFFLLKGNNISEIEIIGSVSNLQIEVNNISNLNLKDFIAKKVLAEIKMGSNVFFNVIEEIEGNILLCSNLKIIGNPVVNKLKKGF